MPILKKKLKLSLDRSNIGSVLARLEYEVPSNLASLKPSLPDGATVESKYGFDREGADNVWNGFVQTPFIEFTVPAYESAPNYDGASFIDTGEWALLETPNVRQWYTAETFDSDIDLKRTITIDEEGVVDQTGIVYLGQYTEYNRMGDDEQIRLIVPEAASLVADPEKITAAMCAASHELNCGARSDEVIAVAAPTQPVNWGPGGRATGDASFWARDTSRLRTPNTTWIHEYIHTRQDFWPAPDAAWFVEGSAVFFAAKIGYELGLLDATTYVRTINQQDGANAQLGSPSVWPNKAIPYRKGATVAAWLDSQLAILGDMTLNDLFRQLNLISEEIDHDTISEICASFVDRQEIRFIDEFENYVYSTDVPERVIPRGIDTEGAVSALQRTQSTEDQVIKLLEGVLQAVEQSNSGDTTVDEETIQAAIQNDETELELDVADSDAEIKRSRGDTDTVDGPECVMCGTPLNTADRCPECGFGTTE